MVFIPDIKSAFVDPFFREPTLTMIGDIHTLDGGRERYEGDPRYVAEKAERYLHKSGIADTCLLGPEFEFYILDHVSYRNSPNHMEVFLDSVQAEWNSADREAKNLGYKVPAHGGYHVDLPMDITLDLRNEMVANMEKLGVPVKYHHSENGGPGQVEIELGFGPVRTSADWTMFLKYVVKTRHSQRQDGHLHAQALFRRSWKRYARAHPTLQGRKACILRPQGVFGPERYRFIRHRGILKHSPAIMAFTNPSTNSYKRLVPGYEAPVSCVSALPIGVRDKDTGIRHRTK